MNLDTVRKCAEIAATARAAALGVVDADIAELLEELNAASVVEEAPAPTKAKKTKAAEAPAE